MATFEAESIEEPSAASTPLAASSRLLPLFDGNFVQLPLHSNEDVHAGLGFHELHLNQTPKP